MVSPGPGHCVVFYAFLVMVDFNLSSRRGTASLAANSVSPGRWFHPPQDRGCGQVDPRAPAPRDFGRRADDFGDSRGGRAGRGPPPLAHSWVHLERSNEPRGKRSAFARFFTLIYYEHEP